MFTNMELLKKLQILNKTEKPQNCICNILFRNVYIYLGVEKDLKGHTPIF